MPISGGAEPRAVARPTRIETLANVMTVVVSLLLSVVLVKQFLLPGRSDRTASPQTAVGTNLTRSLPGVDWKKNGHTLILAISTRCHFCTESAPFFKRIENERAKDVKLVAVLPQPVEEARKYLDGEGVHVDEVRQASLQSIGVAGTPTLLLVDAGGKVSDVWRGKLQPDDEEKVIATLRDSVSR
jgi:peroxiredoxin